MGVEVSVSGLTKSFGSQRIWQDVTLTLPSGEVSVLLGPSGTGKSVFLKSLIGLLRPEKGEIIIDGTDILRCSEKELYEIRKMFGVLFQDGALFGSMNLYDNVAFVLREHTRKSESDIRRTVMDKMELVGLLGAEGKLPGEISGGMRKRAGLARALVLDPEIVLCDEPDSGLDPVRTAYLSQLIIDINAQIDATVLIVTHNITVARTVPDNLGMLFRRKLVMFGPREVLLTSEEPVVEQFLNGRRVGPIGMSEEKDEAQMAEEIALRDAGHSDGSGDEDVRGVVPQLEPTPGLPERQAVHRRRDRVMAILHTLPANAQHGIIDSLDEATRAHYGLDSGAAPAPDTGAAPAPQEDPASAPDTGAPAPVPVETRQPAMSGAPAPQAAGQQPTAQPVRPGPSPVPRTGHPVAQVPESAWGGGTASTLPGPQAPEATTAGSDHGASHKAQRRWFQRGSS